MDIYWRRAASWAMPKVLSQLHPAELPIAVETKPLGTNATKKRVLSIAFGVWDC
jgi:hypothetical protein